MGQDPVADDAKYLVEWLRETGATTFSQRDLYMATRTRFPRAEALLPTLRALERHGHVRRRTATSRPPMGRPPGPVYDVNPLVLAEPADPPTFARFAQGVYVRGPTHVFVTTGRSEPLVSAQ
jgi:hypothetical protein